MSGNPLTITAGEPVSTYSVTLTAKDNNVHGPERKEVTVSATRVTTTDGVTGPATVELTITDNDAAPTVTLEVSPPQISENLGVSTVTATLSHPSSEDTTVEGVGGAP